jgi:hypothetical protein
MFMIIHKHQVISFEEKLEVLKNVITFLTDFITNIKPFDSSPESSSRSSGIYSANDLQLSLSSLEFCTTTTHNQSLSSSKFDWNYYQDSE